MTLTGAARARSERCQVVAASPAGIVRLETACLTRYVHTCSGLMGYEQKEEAAEGDRQ